MVNRVYGESRDVSIICSVQTRETGTSLSSCTMFTKLRMDLNFILNAPKTRA